MPRQTFTRRRWLAAVAAGLTAGCGGRSDAGETPRSTDTATPRPTTARPTTNAASSRTASASEETDPEPAVSFEQGPGECTLDADPVAEGTWPMTHRDPAGTNAAPAANGPTSFPLNERWTVSALEGNVTFPVADGRYLYLVASGADTTSAVPEAAVLAHDPKLNGRIQWRYRIDLTPLDAPVAAGKRVYVPFGTPEDARVVGLDRESGEEVGSYDLPGRYVGGMTTVGSGLVVPTERAYRVFDARTGEHCWSFFPNDLRTANRDERQIRAAATDGGVAYVGTGYPNGEPTRKVGHLYAVDPVAADVAWHVPMEGPVGRIAVHDGTVIAATPDEIVGHAAESGEQLWRHPVASPVRPATLAAAGDTLVYGTRRTLHGLDHADGTERWSVTFGVRGDAIIVGETIYGVGRVDPTTARIWLAAIDVGTGGLRWRQQIYDPLVSVMAARHYLYSTTTDGRLFAFTKI